MKGCGPIRIVLSSPAYLLGPSSSVFWRIACGTCGTSWTFHIILKAVLRMKGIQPPFGLWAETVSSCQAKSILSCHDRVNVTHKVSRHALSLVLFQPINPRILFPPILRSFLLYMDPILSHTADDLLTSVSSGGQSSNVCSSANTAGALETQRPRVRILEGNFTHNFEASDLLRERARTPMPLNGCGWGDEDDTTTVGQRLDFSIGGTDAGGPGTMTP